MSENNIETKKVKFEIEIPVVYYEALLNNPDAIDPDEIMEKIKKAANEALAKTYNNTRIIPAVMKKYLESKHGKPTKGTRKVGKTAEEEPDAEQEETAQAETTSAEQDKPNGNW